MGYYVGYFDGLNYGQTVGSSIMPDDEIVVSGSGTWIWGVDEEPVLI